LDDPVDGTSGSVLDGFGFHDVVIETPVHSVQLCDLESDGIGEVFVAYTKRIQQLVNRHSIKYVQVHFQKY
jgi:UDPglucose--hexose-1-phosphate uridylyltransferase